MKSFIEETNEMFEKEFPSYPEMGCTVGRPSEIKAFYTARFRELVEGLKKEVPRGRFGEFDEGYCVAVKEFNQKLDSILGGVRNK